MGKFDFSGGYTGGTRFGQPINPDAYTPSPSSQLPKFNPPKLQPLPKKSSTWDKIKVGDLKGLAREVGIGAISGLSKTGAVKQNIEAANMFSKSEFPLLADYGKRQQGRIQQQEEFIKSNPVDSVPAMIGQEIPNIPLWMAGEGAVGLAAKGLTKLAPSFMSKASAKLPKIVKGGLKDAATYGSIIAPVETIREGEGFQGLLEREKQLPGVLLGGTALRGVGQLGKGVRDSLSVNPYNRGSGIGPSLRPLDATTPQPQLSPLRRLPTRTETPIQSNLEPRLPRAESVNRLESPIQSTPRERQFAQNVRDSQVATGEIKQNTLDNPLTYEPITNKETFSKAKAIVGEDAVKARDLFDAPSKGISANDVALGEALITKAIKDGDTVGANRLIADLAEKLTTAGQAVQAASIFKRLSPEGMLLYAQRVVNSTSKDLLENMGKKAPKVELTAEDSQFITDTMSRVQTLPDGREKDIAMGLVMRRIADKVPASLSDKAKGLQRISLLLNPKTMIRNTIGNTIFGSIDNLSNVVATPIDKIVGKISGQRTTTLPSISGQLKSGVRGVRETIEDARLGIDTYSGKTQYELPSGRTFDNKGLNALDQATKIGLQLGDRPFYNAAYDDVLRQQMKLAKAEKPTQGMIDQAHKIAQQRTYQDVNAFTDAFKLAQSALNGGKAIGLGNIVLPFVKTPANVLARAVEYSPFGLTKTLKEAYNGIKKNGKFDQKAFVDSISRSVTGTAIIMVGYDLAKKGIITGSGNKDKDVAALERGLGKNDFSFKIGDKYHTYSWAQPASMALAVGADIYLKGKDRKEAENVVFDAVKSGGETLFKQSVMQGLQRFMGGYSPMENIAETIINAPTQAIPTLFNQAGQYNDDIQRSTYDPTNIGTAKNLIKARIPGLNKTLEPKIDTFGKTIQRNQGKNNLFNVFVNPGSSTTFKPTKVQSEILRIYESTGEKSIFPKVAPKTLTEKGRSITLTPKEITQFQQTMGKVAEDRMKSVIEFKEKGTFTQQELDKKKAKELKDAIEKAYDDAKLQLLENRGIE
ncbi:MAG: hypothetical protein M0Z35_00010 [Desulfitobacterium hafniense]|nr:hypothetical protein [Desulfitobacterium hafniense]